MSMDLYQKDMQSKKKDNIFLYLGIILIASALVNMGSLIYIIKKEQQPKVIFPEEFHLVDETDSLKVTYKNDSLIVEFNNLKNQ